MEIVHPNPFPAIGPSDAVTSTALFTDANLPGQSHTYSVSLDSSRSLAPTDLPIVQRLDQPDSNRLIQSKPAHVQSINPRTEAISFAKERDELTGLHRSSSFVSTNHDSDAFSFTRSRAVGLPYPGHSLKYMPGAPLKYDTAARQWQTRMRERGWSINVDGFYGAQSAKICKQFQQEKGLQADSIVGPATWAAAFKSDNLATPKPSSSSGSINPKGLDIVKRFEGLSLTAYLDPVGIWTIGYGHTGPEVGPGDVITRTEAETLLKKDLTKFENAVRSLVKVPINSNQFSALVSFTFNVGTGALSQSTLLARINQKDYQGAADQFSRWVYGGGQVLPGLVTRRNAERSLFLQPA